MIIMMLIMVRPFGLSDIYVHCRCSTYSFMKMGASDTQKWDVIFLLIIYVYVCGFFANKRSIALVRKYISRRRLLADTPCATTCWHEAFSFYKYTNCNKTGNTGMPLWADSIRASAFYISDFSFLHEKKVSFISRIEPLKGQRASIQL